MKNILKILKLKTASTIDFQNIIKELKTGSDRNEKKILLFTFLNPYSYLIARKKTEIFLKFSHIFIDGILLVKFLNFFAISKCKRNSFDMTSLAPEIFRLTSCFECRVYLIGSNFKNINQSVKNIKEKFKELNICGFSQGYFNNESEKKNIIKKIIDLNPDIVIVGMGTPLQDLFLIELSQNGWRGIGFTCGGFFHQSSKKLYYYPKLINKFGIRWIYRLYNEPYLFKRYFYEYPKFVFCFIIDILNNK